MGIALLGSHNGAGGASKTWSRIEQLGSKIGSCVTTEAGFTNQDWQQIHPRHGLFLSIEHERTCAWSEQTEPDGAKCNPAWPGA